MHSMRAADRDGHRFLTPTSSYGEDLKRIVLVVDETIRTRGKLSRVVSTPRGELVEYTPLGRRFADLLRIPLKELEYQFPNHEFSPLYIVFKRATRHLREAHPFHTVERFDEAIERLRRYGSGTVLKRRLDSMKRGERATGAQVRDLCAHLRAERSRVMALRIDLGLHVIWAQGADLVVPPVDLAEMQGYRSQLIRWLDRGPMSKYLLAYIWKLEWGIEKGYHIHLAVMLDGNRLRKDSIIGNIIGRVWARDITGEKGMYYNCNRNKQRYTRCALGTLHRSDAEQWGCLEQSLRYLTKSDFFLRLQVPEKTRTFGIGGLHAAKLRAMRKQIPPVHSL
ncbi:hypothetical protein J2W68_001441 [Luteimonas terrae]|uniref:YagK/YfjJ C-terminal domain-containing protein n=1 Tax=Luteimonas terrae TaxID=1530191 RepID=A0ABU1XWU1_9GAMM|nr:hypothetical protein [Luteimonas terrae]